MVRIDTIASALALAATATSASAAETAAPDVAKFAALESVKSISISPDGDKVVFVAPRPDGGENAIVIDLKTANATPIFSAEGNEEQISGCNFILEDRVICRAYFRQGSNRNVAAASRLVSLAADGSDLKLLTARTPKNALYSANFGGSIIDYNVQGAPGSVLMMRWKPHENSTGTMLAKTDAGLMVEEVDVYKLSRKQVVSPLETALDFISDGQGNIRLMETQQRNERGYAEPRYDYSYRAAGEDGWHALNSVTLDGSLSYGFEPVAVDSRENVAYGFDAHGGFTGLFKLTLDGAATKSLVLGRDDVDVDSLLMIGRNQRIIGASYATEKRAVEYFDPELKRLAAGLAQALGGGKQVSIVDADKDENKLIVFAGSDTDPGAFYLFDKTTKQLGLLLPSRPAMAGVAFGKMTPIAYPAADGTMIPGYLTLPPGSDGKNLPAIVMPHGGPSARDEWGFDWLVQFFVSRGYAVLQPNFRGSSGYGSSWFQKNGFQSWETAVGDINAAGHWLEKEGIAAQGKLAIFGWSYGGYAALQSGVVEPGLFKAIVAVAPVTDLDRLKSDAVNDSNYRLVEAQVGNGPHVAAGSPAQHADRISVPVLLVHGDADTNVLIGHSRLMRDRLKSAGKQVDYLEFKKLEHSLVDVEARKQLLLESDATIRKALGFD